MNHKLRSLLILVFALVFGISSIQLVRQYLAYAEARRSNEAALEAAAKATEPPTQLPTVPPTQPLTEPLTEPPTEPLTETPTEPPDEAEQYLLDMDLEALRATNPDVLGWIYIPDTVISYPLMKADDNQEYLYLTWDGKWSKYGSIFLECRNSHDLSDFNTMIYGHNMLTEDMFGTLSDYKEQSHYETHPSVYILLDEGVKRYDIFSAYDAQVVSDTYRLIFEDDIRRQSSLDLYTSSSVLESELVPTVEDRILTLSTCTGRGTADLRFVVQAVLAKETERAGSN